MVERMQKNNLPNDIIAKSQQILNLATTLIDNN